MDKNEFKELYYSLSLKQVAIHFNCSVPTVINTAKRLGIPLKRGKGKIKIENLESK